MCIRDRFLGATSELVDDSIRHVSTLSNDFGKACLSTKAQRRLDVIHQQDETEPVVFARQAQLKLRGRASEQGREVERGDVPLTGEGKVLTGDSVLAVAEYGAQQTDRLG